MADAATTATQAVENYRVLARKYRPGTFDALIGQDAMVRTLSNAIASGRLAHAFLLTGVRGVGKTSTARLIAKALNCTGVDGTGGPTMAPCSACDNCTAIAESRHMDVIEMDAASRTGVDDVREIIESVRYAPVSARYKIYIIDEVHMLTKNAFNALLKTLEEPPPHVKFLFATTEIRKLPVTVLSRCQRFDLKRIPQALLAAHFQTICAAEAVAIDAESLALIARAAEGSVRDGLSILDQAIAHGAGSVAAAAVRDMLGLADRFEVVALMDAVLAGRSAESLTNLREQYDGGADPVTIIEDLLALTHAITRTHVAGVAPDGPEAERSKTASWADALKPAAAHRLWQMLLKGLADIAQAPSPIDAAEMLILRVQHAAHMPDPGDILARLEAAPPAPAAAPALPSAPVAHAAPVMATLPALPALPQDFAQLVTMFEVNREGLLGKHLRDDVEFVALEDTHLTIHLLPGAPRDLPARLKACLERWTGQAWQIELADSIGVETLRVVEADARQLQQDLVRAHPLVVAALAQFPGSQLTEILSHDVAARNSDASDDEPQDNPAENYA